MNKEQLDTLLFQLTPNEIEYKKNKDSYSKRFKSQDTTFILGKEVYILYGKELKDYDIALRKDSRFSFMPFYTYNCINLNYIYSGQCTYYIDDKEVVLKKGDICIFDRGTVRTKMVTGYNDIIINIILREDYFKNTIQIMQSQNLLAQFVAKTLETNTSHDNYIIFYSSKNEKIPELFNEILFEYYEKKNYASQVIQSYLSIIMIELLRSYQDNNNLGLVQFSNSNSSQILQMIAFIENNYVQCTLEDLSKEFGYHEKYICSLLKKQYNKTFKQIQTEYRIKYASRYLIHSDLTIQEISQKVGFNNLNQFYKIFDKFYHTTPSKYRKTNKEAS